MRYVTIKKLLIPFTMTLLLIGCVAAPVPVEVQMPTPSSLVAPAPIEDSSGAFLSPYTSDGVLAEWVDKAVSAKAGAALGGAVGNYAGQQATENIPFIGGFIGQKLGEEAGRKIALEAAGGEQYMRETSDLSFATLEDLAVYIYVNHSSHEHYQDALSATMEIYPQLKMSYQNALLQAAN